MLFLPVGGRSIIPTWWRSKYYSLLVEEKVLFPHVEAKVLFLTVGGRSNIPTWWKPKSTVILPIGSIKLIYTPDEVKVLFI